VMTRWWIGRSVPSKCLVSKAFKTAVSVLEMPWSQAHTLSA